MTQIISIFTIFVVSTFAAFSTTSHLFGNLGRSVTPVKTGVQTKNNVLVPPKAGDKDVLGESTESDSVTFNVDAIFNKALIIKGKITADNIVYGIRAGSGVGVGSSDPQTPVITNTGVLSVQGKTGELKLEQGSGITIDGLKITNSGIISLTSGTGITVSGSTITNSDLGSSQNIFKTLSVSGQDDIVAGSNTDTLTFTAGSGITLTTDSTNDKLTITSNDPSIAGGWTHAGTDIHLTTSTDSVGIGTTDPSYKLHVVGTEYVSDTLTAGGALSVTGNTTLTGALSANGNVTLGNATTDSLTFVGRIANGTSLVPDTDLGSNLGTETNRFNNLWVANINSNSSQAFSGQTTFSYPPQDTTTSEASVFINPASSVANGQLLGFGIAGYQKALIDEDGDIVLGYSDATSAPTTDYPLTIYGHSGTNVAYVDTSGNLNITGGYSISGNSVLNATTLGTGVVNSSLTSTGTLNSGSITSGFGSIDTGSDNIVTTGTVGSAGLTSFTGNSLAVNSITSTGNLSILPTGNVGIGTATPAQKLTVVGDLASSVATGVEGLKLTDTSDVTKLAMKWTSAGVTFDTPGSGATALAITNSTTGLGGLSVESTTTLNSGLASLQALIVKGFSGQTEDLQEWQDSTGTVLASISPTGGFTTSGNLDINGTTNDIAGTLNLSGNSLTSSGALSISPTAGSNISFSLSGTGDMIVNTNDLVVDTSSGFVGIGTSVPSVQLDISATSGTDAFRLTNSGSKVLGLSYGTNSTTFDQTSTDPTNKLLNGTFDTNLTSWSEAPSYTLNDEFTTDKTPAELDADTTTAEPTGGIRTVTDTNDKLSITGSRLSFATGSSGNYDGLRYSLQTRTAGKVMIGSIAPADTTIGRAVIGNDSNTALSATEFIMFKNNVGINIADSTYDFNVGSYTAGTTYQIASIHRTNGMYWFIKGGAYTNWTLLGNNPVGSGDVYPSILAGNASSIFTADNIRIPTATWLPTPLAYDDFASADMTTKSTGPDAQTAPQLAWTGGSDAGGVMKITPTLGSELVTNGDMELDSNWTNISTPTTNERSTEQTHGGTYSRKVVSDAGYEGIVSDTFSPTIGQWGYVSGWAYPNATGALLIETNGGGISSSLGYTGGTWSQFHRAGRFLGPFTESIKLRPVSASTWYFDDVSVVPLTLSSLFSSVSTSDADVITDADVTVTIGTQAGIVTNLNDTTTPTDFRIIYTDGNNIKVDDVVGGTYTNKLSVLHSSATALNYAAGRTLRVITQGTTMRVYYNNTLVGSEITTLGANTNTKHGLFSTYSTNSFDNFTLWPRGTGGEFEQITPVNLTATRETTIKYNNSTASVKLVASTTDADYVQSVNVGDTSTYNLIAYAYTTGAVVSASDLSLYYDTGTLTTTYTPMGATGWYKLTGTLTGVASAKDYGVRVKAGKTVYVDEMHLQVGTGTTQNMYVMNSNTGVTGLNVQGLINGTLNGVATFSKAGTISDADFAGGVTDGMMAIDTTNHRVYFREGGAWSYSAKAGGFQIPKEEVLGLSTGDYLLPYVDNFMSDGAVHGMYQKFDLNKLLSTQGAVTFVSDVTFLGKTVFNKDTAGTAIISTYSSSVDVKFDNTYDVSPIITMNLVIDSTDSAFIEEGQKAYLTNVSPTGFTIMLPALAMKDFMYKWIAIPIKEKNVTKSQPVIITPTIIP